MQLFYAPDLTTPRYTLGEEESKHCIRVLRLRRGDTLHLTDGRGTLYRCEIAEEDARRCTVRVVERFPDYERMPYRLTWPWRRPRISNASSGSSKRRPRWA